MRKTEIQTVKCHWERKQDYGGRKLTETSEKLILTFEK